MGRNEEERNSDEFEGYQINDSEEEKKEDLMVERAPWQNIREVGT